MIRIGQSMDIHRLVEGRPLLLGGITIPSPKGEEAYSDGDVLLHAIGEAILGALGLGDLGTHFPSNDPHYHNINSQELIREILRFMEDEGYQINNLDTLIQLETPKISPYKNEIRNAVASLLGIEPHLVNIKAGTNEGIDTIGKGDAIVAYCTVLLIKEGK